MLVYTGEVAEPRAAGDAFADPVANEPARDTGLLPAVVASAARWVFTSALAFAVVLFLEKS